MRPTLLALAFMIWLRESLGERNQAGGFSRTLIGVTALGLVVSSLVLLGRSRASQNSSPNVQMAGLNWIPFNEAEIAKHTAAGRSVFVDVTAEWCFTCKINERLVLSAREVVEALRPLVLMRADWTNNDPAISDYLRRNGRAVIARIAHCRRCRAGAPSVFGERGVQHATAPPRTLPHNR